MISRGKNGRRRSVTTGEELGSLSNRAVINLGQEELALLDALTKEGHLNKFDIEDDVKNTLYHTIPVSMAEFLINPYYLGESCTTLYPELREDLISLFDYPYRESIWTGGIGVGKTHGLSIAISRIIYELSCMYSPQKAFGLSSGTEMVLPLISKNLTLAREIMKSAVDEKIKESPYFMTKFTPDFKKEYTLFPHGIRLTIGSYGSDRVLGSNVFSAALDECVTKKSIVSVEKDGVVCKKTVDNLMAMSQIGYSDCKIVCLDHDDGTLKSGWWRIKESTVQQIVRIETDFSVANLSREHPVLVKSGEWMIYKYAKDIVIGDIIAMEVNYASKRSTCERGNEEKTFGSSKEENGRKESVFREETFRRGKGEDEGSPCEAEDSSLGGNEAEDKRIPEGEKIFSGDQEENERGCEAEMCRSRMEKEAVGDGEESQGGRAPNASSACAVRGGKSILWEEAYEEGEKTYQRGKKGRWWNRAYRCFKAENFRGERKVHKGQSEELLISSEIPMWGDGSLSHYPRRKARECHLFSAGSGQRYRGGQERLGGIRNRRAEKTNCGGFYGNKVRWTNCHCRRKGTVFPVCGEGACEIQGDVEVLSEKRIFNDTRLEQSGSSRCFQWPICDPGICGFGDGWKDACQKNGDELKFAGVRRERIRVLDLPPGLFLSKVICVSDEKPEQTYSICTEFNTFIADGIVVHNTNFPPKRKAQQISTGFGQKLKAAHFDIVEKMYLGLVRRIKSRFQKAGGGFPGMVILASSAATVESFTERKIRDGKDDPEIFVRDHTQWTVKPDEEFCGEVFWVLCSTSAMKSRILTEDEYDMVTDEWMEANDAFVMDIPIEFKSDFESNMEEALRDIAGFSTEAISQFVQRPKAILSAIDPERVHPFSDEEWVAGSPGKFLWNHLSIKFQRRLPGGFKEDAFKPRRNPRAMRWVHLDTSTSGDSSGMAVGHIDRWVEVVQTDSEGGKQVDVLPFYIIDFMLRINPPPGEQIYMPNLRTMIYQFMAKGYQIAGVSTDTYQYVEMHQQIRRRGISTHIISMDTSTEPYDELKSAFYDNRIEIYNYKPFIDEFKFLEYDRLSGTIDHPVAGSKDVSDAVAGVVHGLKTLSKRMPLQGEKHNSRITPHEFSWVTPMIPADQVDIEAVKEAKKDDFEDHFMPILFDED